MNLIFDKVVFKPKSNKIDEKCFLMLNAMIQNGEIKFMNMNEPKNTAATFMKQIIEHRSKYHNNRRL